jgi:protein TonB
MQDYVTRQRSPQRHAVGLALVLVLHALLLWAIQSGLSREVTRKIQVVADVLLLSPQRPVPAEPPPPAAPPPPKNLPAPARSPLAAAAPQPETALPVPPSAQSVTVAPSVAAPVAAAPAAPTAAAPSVAAAPRSEPVRTPAVVQSAQCEKPEYPSASRRMEEEGTVHLRFLIGVDGRVIQSEVEKSSGFKRLDEAARAGLAKCQFRPATVDGKPEQAWSQMRYVWRLE